MVDFTDKEKELIEQVLRYRRNNLIQMVGQDKRIHPQMVDFIMLEDSILKKLNIEKS